MTIKIRHTEPDDYLAIHQIFSAEKVIWGTLQLPYPSAEMWRRRLADPPVDRVSLVACVDDVVVGQISMGYSNRPRRKHVGSIGMAVRDDWHGKGVGSALMQAVCDMADSWLNLTRLELDVFVDNAAGIALYKKFGFEIEGTKRNFAFRDGQYVDCYVMGRIKDE